MNFDPAVLKTSPRTEFSNFSEELFLAGRGHDRLIFFQVSLLGSGCHGLSRKWVNLNRGLIFNVFIFLNYYIYVYVSFHSSMIIFFFFFSFFFNNILLYL